VQYEQNDNEGSSEENKKGIIGNDPLLSIYSGCLLIIAKP